MPVKRLFFLMILAALVTSLYAQDSDKYFRKLPQEGFTLYFLSPASFKAKPGKVKMETDYTFQYQSQMPESVEMKFSVYAKTALRSIDSLSFFGRSGRIGTVALPKLMFLQKEKGKWHSRFSTTLSYPTLQQMLEAGPELTIEIFSGRRALHFPAGRDWREAAAILKEILAVEIGAEP